MEIEELVGQKLIYIDIDPEENRIMLTTESGRKILIHHNQDCCEIVRIEDTAGNWAELIGKVIVEATHESHEADSESGYESCTRTALTFKADDATVISRWIGTSNGYYSEEVHLADVTNNPYA